MTITLASKPGLDGSKVLSIPKDWNSSWYRDHINNLLKGADVRNAVGANGIVVSGNITSPYATIGTKAPLTIPAVAGGSPFFKVSVPNPSATVPVMGTWTGGGGAVAQVAIDIGNSSIFSYPDTGATAGANLYIAANLYYDGFWRYKTANPVCQYAQTPNSSFAHVWSTAPSAAAGSVVSAFLPRLGTSPAGNVTCGPADSGVTLTVTGVANNDSVIIQSNTTTGQAFGLYVAGGTNASDFAMAVQNAGRTQTMFEIVGNGQILFPIIGTTASAANAFVDGANNNNLLRSTSSRRYKQDIHPVRALRSLFQLKPITYRSKAAADDQRRQFLGLVAEDVADADSRLVNFDRDGKPDGVQYERLTVLLLAYIQRLHATLSAAGIVVPT